MTIELPQKMSMMMVPIAGDTLLNATPGFYRPVGNGPWHGDLYVVVVAPGVAFYSQFGNIRPVTPTSLDEQDFVLWDVEQVHLSFALLTCPCCGKRQ